MSDDARAVVILKAIRLAAMAHPFPEGSNIVPNRALALGEIAGICSRALSDQPQDHPK